jgi:hypothetical protein
LRLPYPAAWGEHETTAQEIEARPAKHLALEHFQTIDLALHRPVTPAQREPRFDGGIVLTEPLGKPLDGPHGTCSGALQPGIELHRPPPAHELRKVLRQVNRLGEFGVLGA